LGSGFMSWSVKYLLPLPLAHNPTALHRQELRSLFQISPSQKRGGRHPRFFNHPRLG
jgi:hypothetical protein